MDTWFFVTADYTFGHSLEADATGIINASGGRVLGAVRHPLGTTDMSSYLLQAKASGAKGLAFANAGADFVNSLKQAHEFGLGTKRLAALLAHVTDIEAIGPELAQGLFCTSTFYWDLNDRTRAWSGRFAARAGGRMPTMNHAGVYSSTLAYLRAAAAADTVSGAAVVARMGAAPIDDPLFGATTIRPDGRAVHDMYLFEVKAPAESRGRWDYYKLAATIPAGQAFRPMAGGGCPLVQ